MKNKLLTLTTTLLVSLFSNVAYSQVNIESLRDTSKKQGSTLQLGASFLGQTGNNNIYSGELKSDYHYRVNNNYIFLKVQTIKGKKDNEYFVDNSFLHARYTKMFKQYIGLEVFSQIQNDKFKKLKLRQLNGLGARSEVLKGKKDIISVGIGAMTDFEIVEDADKLDYRATSYISVAHGFDKENRNQLTLVGYYQPLFSHPEDYRINAEMNLKSSLIDSLNLSLELTVVYLYDTNPPDDVLTNDFIIKTGFLIII